MDNNEDHLLVDRQYGRMKGASWFPSLYKKDIIIIGQGGIGSWLSLLAARAGCSLNLYDMDDYEKHNMSGQLVKSSAVGVNKAKATSHMIQEFSPDTNIAVYGEYTEESYTNDIVLCGLDKMAPRKVAFKNWKDYIEDAVGDEKAHFFFQDGRLTAEQLQIFNIPGDRPDLIERYEKEYLFDDSEVQEATCTFKQTSHTAAMIASHMIGFLTNWISNRDSGKQIRRVPFFYEYFIPIDYTNKIN